MATLPNLPGWHLLGAFPQGDPDGVGSWLLHNDSEAMLLEIPPGLTADIVAAGLGSIRSVLRYVTASHLHGDHLDINCWNELQVAFHGTHFIRPTASSVGSEILMNLGGEPLWFIKAPKHSPSDTVTVFRGVAMMGDIELGTLDSVNEEVSRGVKAASMEYLRGFESRTGYKVHMTVSAHLNDFREWVDWPSLFDAK